MQSGKPLSNRDVVYVSNIDWGSFAGLRMGGREMVKKLIEVAGIISQRMFTDVALVAQMFEKLS